MGKRAKKTNVFRGDSEWVDDVQFSPDGKLIASGTVDGSVKLWNRATGKEIRSLNGHLSQVNHIRFSQDGQRIAAANYDGTIALWEVATGRELNTLPGHSSLKYPEVQDLLFSPNGQFLVSQGKDNVPKLWEVATGKEVKTFGVEEQFGQPGHIQFSSDSQTLVYSTGQLQDQSVRFWSIAENRELRNIPVPGDPFLSPDGKVIAVIDYKPLTLEATTDLTEGIISLWDTATGNKVKTLSNLPGEPAKVYFSPDSSLIAVYTYKGGSRLGPNPTRNGKVTLWNRDGTKLRTLEQLGDLGVKFSPDGRKIAIDSAGVAADGWHTIFKLWDVSTGKLLQTLSDEAILFSSKGISVGLASRFSPDGQTIAAISSSGIAKFFDTSTGKQLNRPDISQVRNLDRPPIVSKDEKRATVLRTDGSLRRRDLSTGQETPFARWDSVLTSAVHISDDDKTITTVNWYGKLQERELATGQILRYIDLPFHKFVSALEFSPNGQKIAASMSDKTVRIWDATTGQEINVLQEYASQAEQDNSDWRRHELHFSSDGKIVATLSGENALEKGANLELWEGATGKAIQFSETPRQG